MILIYKYNSMSEDKIIGYANTEEEFFDYCKMNKYERLDFERGFKYGRHSGGGYYYDVIYFKEVEHI